MENEIKKLINKWENEKIYGERYSGDLEDSYNGMIADLQSLLEFYQKEQKGDYKRPYG